MDNKEDVGKRIQYLRKNHLHITQAQLAERVRVSRSNLGNVETGTIGATKRLIEDICREYKVNRQWLEYGEGGDDNIFVKVTPFEQAYSRFGYLIENSTPSKKAALSMILELLYTVPDDQWDMIMRQYEEYKKAIERENK